MSATDFRRLIDLHGDAFIGVECNDGTTIHIGINGNAPARVTLAQLHTLVIPRLRERMNAMIDDGFKTFTFRFGNASVDLNYYDAGHLLDVLSECVRYLT